MVLRNPAPDWVMILGNPWVMFVRNSPFGWVMILRNDTGSTTAYDQRGRLPIRSVMQGSLIDVYV